ncbi:MAG TPA: Gfo/Idh/MocA family oxidoreductase [Armatimonadota bacterium]|nr:Gfo/Idh/MocA family oxidoreductase [Armatimonadota bacterium]
MAKRQLNVGLIGYKFMGAAHSNAYRQVGRFFDLPVEVVMKAIAGRDAVAVRAAAAKLGWQEYETDYRRLVKRPDIDLVDITSANNAHAEMAIAAARAGKHVFCEKPLAMDLAEARRMVRAVERAGVKHAVCFNYRAAPAVTLARRIIDEGRIGRIFHWRAQYLQDWIVDPKFPLVWRLQKEVAGSGAHGDLAAHLIDLAHYLVGDIAQVVGDMTTFIKQRPRLKGTAGGLRARKAAGKGRVTVDDASAFLARFADGAMGTFEATRFAPGRKNHNCFEINGSKGSLRFCLERMNELEFYDGGDPAHLQGFRTILVTDPSHPYIGAWWPPGHIIGYEHTFVHTVYNVITAISQDRLPSPNFHDGLRCQAVLEAVSNSVASGGWEKVPRSRV